LASIERSFRSGDEHERRCVLSLRKLEYRPQHTYMCQQEKQNRPPHGGLLDLPGQASLRQVNRRRQVVVFVLLILHVQVGVAGDLDAVADHLGIDSQRIAGALQSDLG
jgi:hypothetical protein